MNSNTLSQAKSLYLQQHAHHPVHWQEWSEEAFSRAKSEHKLVVLSIGYSACHWCHVMAEESFEDGAVADLMNAEFVSVKIDREELPDVDALYMQAAQLMGVRGGWPLNVICTPDKQAVWAITYLPKERWISSLRQLAQLYRKEPNTVAEYAEKLTHALQATPAESQEHFQLRLEDFLQVENHFDYEYGGLSGAPKFPLFPLLQASLDIGVLRAKPTLLQWVHHSLEVLSRSALYDQLEGGFARYTVDEAWELPHFEKMLYDNALAILIYAKAQQHQPSEMYERILEESSHWLRGVMKGDGALIAGSMDAVNSDGEGAYYTWTIPELQACLGEHFSDFDRHFKLKAFDQLEGRATLLLKEEAQLHELDTLRGKMLLARTARPQPAIDPKLVTQWNGLLAEAWISAYDSSLQEKYLDWAQAIVDGLLDRYFKSDKLYRAYYGEEGQGAASLEDYSACLSALIQLIGRRPSTAYFSAIDALFGQVHREFAREGTPFFALRSNVEAPLIAEQFVLQDQVTPSGNSQMAINLWRWGHISGRVDLHRQSESMLHALPKEEVTQHALYYSQWHLLQSWISGSYYTCLISGPEADDWWAQLQQPYRPNRCYLLNDQKREFGLYAHRYDEKKTRMYICEGMHCRLPLDNLGEAQAALSKV